VEDPDGHVVELTVDAPEPEEEWAHLENPTLLLPTFPNFSKIEPAALRRNRSLLWEDKIF
jgi:hypothetical protein